MKAKTLGALVLGLLSSCTSPSPSFPPPVSEMHRGFPWWDQEHVTALKRFYFASLQPPASAEDHERPLVLVVTPHSYSHGYMIDDSGLVLTVFHAVSDVDHTSLDEIVITDSDGNIYPAHRTQIEDPFHDYAVVIAKTEKPSHTHPLPVGEVTDYEKNAPLTFSVLSPHVYPSFSLATSPSFSLVASPTPLKGELIGVRSVLQEAQEGYRGTLDEQQERESALSFPSLKERGMLALQGAIARGYSGTPVFTEGGYFAGLVQSFFADSTLTMGFLANPFFIMEGIRGFLQHSAYSLPPDHR